MHIKSSVVFLITAILLSACSKANIADVVDMDLLTHGGWYEDYEGYQLQEDGRTSYYFDCSSETFPLINAPGILMIGTYNMLTQEATRNDYKYSVQRGTPNTITVFYTSVGTTYDVIKLDKYEMSWQKIGTEFSPGTVGSNFLHFLRVDTED